MFFTIALPYRSRVAQARGRGVLGALSAGLRHANTIEPDFVFGNAS